MTFSDPLLLFTHLIEFDEANMLINLRHFCSESSLLYRDTRALIDAHYTNRNQSGFTALVGTQADLLCDDHKTQELSGNQVGPYLLETKLGHGGMSAVYLGQRNDGLIAQEVAIKFVYSSIAHMAGETFIQREAQFLASLSHPNIAKVYNIDTTTEGVPYIVMEFVRGKTLNECDISQFSEAAKLSILSQLCSALTEAHQNSIVHADIKPSNVIVETNLSPKLLDFGIANSLHDAERQQLTAASSHFTSPQQRAGNKPNVTDDIYSLGQLMIFLLGHSRNVELNAIMNKATSQESHSRFQSMEQFSSAISAYRNNQPLLWHNNTRRYVIKKWFQRSPTAAFLTIAFPIALLTGLSILYLQNNKLVNEADKNQQILDFYGTLFEVNTPTSARGGALSAADFINEGIALVNASNVADTKTKASITSTLSTSLLNLGYLEQAENVISEVEDESILSAFIYAKAAFLRGNYHNADAWIKKYNIATEHASFDGLFLASQIDAHLYPARSITNRLDVLHQRFGHTLSVTQQFALQRAMWEQDVDTNATQLLVTLNNTDVSSYTGHQLAWYFTIKAQAETATNDLERSHKTMSNALTHTNTAFNNQNPEKALIYNKLMWVAAAASDDLTLEMLLTKQQSLFSSLRPLFDHKLLPILEQQHNYYLHAKQYAQSASYISSAYTLCRTSPGAACERITIKHAAALYFTNDYSGALDILSPLIDGDVTTQSTNAFIAHLISLNSYIGLGFEVTKEQLEYLASLDSESKHTAAIISAAARAGHAAWAIDFGRTHSEHSDVLSQLALIEAYTFEKNAEQADSLFNKLGKTSINSAYSDSLLESLSPAYTEFSNLNNFSALALAGDNIILSNRRVRSVLSPGNADMLTIGTPFTFKWQPTALKGENVSLYINHKNNFSRNAFDSWSNIQNIHWHLFASDVKNSGELVLDPLVMMANGVQGFKVMIVSDHGYWAINEGFFGVESGNAADNGLKEMMVPNLLVDAISKPQAYEVYNVGQRNHIVWNNDALKGNMVAIYVLHDSPHNIGNGTNVHFPTVLKRRWYLVSDRTLNSGSYELDPSQFNGQGNAYKILIISEAGYWAVSDERFTVVNPH